MIKITSLCQLHLGVLLLGLDDLKSPSTKVFAFVLAAVVALVLLKTLNLGAQALGDVMDISRFMSAVKLSLFLQ
jgi:hypothetical protein